MYYYWSLIKAAENRQSYKSNSGFFDYHTVENFETEHMRMFNSKMLINHHLEIHYQVNVILVSR